jgi:oxygen-independent coproporphyrinogen-3 oxidase
LPPEEDRGVFFLQASVYLGMQGYDHYEVSNFARGAVHQSRHNRKYWEHTPYLGLGPAAHSFDGRRRWWNEQSLGGYLEKSGQNLSSVEKEETLSPEQLRLESLLLGFRTRSGVALENLSLDRSRRKVLTALEETGKIVRREDRLIPTTEGFLVADRLPLLFC